MIYRVLYYIQISSQECLSLQHRPINNMAQRISAILMLLLLYLVDAQAQQIKQGSFGALSGVRVATVEYDFSKAMVEAEPLIDFVQTTYLVVGDEWLVAFESAQKEVIAEFIEEFNESNCPILLSVSDRPSVVLIISVKQISRNGNTVICDYTFKDKSTGAIILNIAMTAKDGRIGSFTNLMGDAFAEAGKKLGKYMKKNLKYKQQKRV